MILCHYPTDSKYVRLISSRLRNFKQKKDYLWNFSCPFCGDSQKNKTKARGYVFQKGNNLFYRCHNCGVSTNVGNLIKQVDDSLHKEYVLERYSLVKPITPVAPTPSSTSRHRDLIKLQNKKSSNTANGSAIYRVDIFV
jgi:transcription elongation factor Elf1